MAENTSGIYRPEGAAETPYMRARDVWDRRIGSARQQAYTWRLVALFALAMTSLMGIALIWKSMSSEVVPYIVEVDGGGEVRLVGMAQTQVWAPNDGVQRFFLREWVESVRGVSSDVAVVRAALLRAYDGSTRRAQGLLDQQVKESNPLELAKKQTRHVKVTAMARVSDESWRVEWTEVSHDEAGQKIDEQRMMGVFELKIRTPETREEIEDNPLGLFVEHFSWSRVDAGEAE